VRRRRTAEPLPGSPAAELADWVRVCAERAAGGDERWAERLVSARSWAGMLRAAGNDAEVGELFVMFARDDRAWYGAAG
jgi:hypothetical protein